MKLQNTWLSLSGPGEIQHSSRVVHLEKERTSTTVPPGLILHLLVWPFHTLNPWPVKFLKNKKGRETKGAGRVAVRWRDSLGLTRLLEPLWLSEGQQVLFPSSSSCLVLLSLNLHPPPPITSFSLALFIPSVPRKEAWWITDVLWHIVSFITRQPQSY